MFEKTEHGFQVKINGRVRLEHAKDAPLIYAGSGDARYDSLHGNFHIQDYLVSRVPLRDVTIDGNELKFRAYPGVETAVRARFEEGEGAFTLHFLEAAPGYTRFWIVLSSRADEHFYGCGEQMSYFDLKGREYPLWTSEPGVGRDPLSPIALAANQATGSGGDYYTVNFPQPSFVSSDKYLVHLEASSYMRFDFRRDGVSELCAWQLPKFITLQGAESFKALSGKVSVLFGEAPALPGWVNEGVILGVQGGTEAVLQKLEKARALGIAVTALFCQDWEGRRVTSFGKRLMWNWKWNEREYPGLDRVIGELKAQGIRFLGYVNPYLAVDGDLYLEGRARNAFVKNRQGEDYIIDFGEFDCATVDLTSPDACAWYKGVLKRNMLDFGLDGWMADFGEYLPADAVMFDGATGLTAHNRFPALWAKLNHEVMEESGRSGDALFFMRSGFTGSQRHCPLLWAGDQSVDFSRHDGLISVVSGALSSGVLGMKAIHSDIGGYTSLYGNRRTRELLIRWAEMSPFMAVMRTHEGNRPDENLQYYDDPEAGRVLAKMARVFIHLTPYRAESLGGALPLIRPLFYEDEADRAGYTIWDQFLSGSDLLVAPVHQEGARSRRVYIPRGIWIHLFTGEAFEGGAWHAVDAPLGCPPAFYRQGSKHEPRFAKVVEIE